MCVFIYLFIFYGSKIITVLNSSNNTLVMTPASAKLFRVILLFIVFFFSFIWLFEVGRPAYLNPSIMAHPIAH